MDATAVDNAIKELDGAFSEIKEASSRVGVDMNMGKILVAANRGQRELKRIKEEIGRTGSGGKENEMGKILAEIEKVAGSYLEQKDIKDLLSRAKKENENLQDHIDVVTNAAKNYYNELADMKTKLRDALDMLVNTKV